MAAQLKRDSTVCRACSAILARKAESASKVQTVSAKSAPPLRINRSRSSVRSRPAQPVGVQTIALPHAIASMTLMFVPAETCNGATTTAARA